MCPALLAVHEHMNAYGPSYSSFLGSYQLVKHDFILIQLGFKVYRLNTCTVCLYCIHVSRYCIYSTIVWLCTVFLHIYLCQMVGNIFPLRTVGLRGKCYQKQIVNTTFLMWPIPFSVYLMKKKHTGTYRTVMVCTKMVHWKIPGSSVDSLRVYTHWGNPNIIRGFSQRTVWVHTNSGNINKWIVLYIHNAYLVRKCLSQ